MLLTNRNFLGQWSTIIHINYPTNFQKHIHDWRHNCGVALAVLGNQEDRERVLFSAPDSRFPLFNTRRRLYDSGPQITYLPDVPQTSNHFHGWVSTINQTTLLTFIHIPMTDFTAEQPWVSWGKERIENKYYSWPRFQFSTFQCYIATILMDTD